ncbi:late blight resistance protein R1-A-like [Salvia divinorum]|uniref:Late blight resistance protein R1-A-like n=1 Tax=Salvia divinorum TaxID=28513 RepID=A0ABD1HL47_SALDI
MADAATEFLLNNLKELVQYEAHLINDTEGNIEKLKSDLLHFQAFLKDTVKMRKSNERIELMRKEIHNVVYDVEDIIDAYMAKHKDAGKSSRFFKKFLTTHQSLLNLHTIGQKVEAISGRVTQLRKDVNLTTDDDDKKEIPSEPRPPRKDKNVVGFQDVTDRLIHRLTQEADGLDVISLTEDYEISASKLIRMWIGEGFIQQKDARTQLEEVGQNYLKDLISRNLVKTLKFRADGNVKTCQIHDTLRDFCRMEAATENFLQEIRLNEQGECVPPIFEWCRRLSIHSDCKRYISSKSSTPRARSFVCFSKEPCDELSGKDSTNLIKAFKFLRVFDIQPLILKDIDTDLYTLIHMRYIALFITLSMLSPDFNKICNMQTLIVNTTSPTLTVKANIWRMRHLRYFKTNASATLPSAKSGDCANELQTLGLISVESCKGLHKRAPNLKKLGIRGKLALLSEEKGPFDSVRKMRYLGKLKLVNDKAQETESLQKLEVLKLKYQAFIGNSWELEDAIGGFPSLQFLHVEQTDLAFWQAKSHHYPRLRSLVLKHCDKLREIPVDLGKASEFKLSIFPPPPPAPAPAK